MSDQKKRIVISASRRTDIPAFYMPWFMKQIIRGYVETINPYNRRVKTTSLLPRNIHSIVFWSKNFGPFIAGGYGERLLKAGYRLFFNFTVNSKSRRLEPSVPRLGERIDQMRQLCATYGAGAVTWRFDPICFFDTASGRQHNLADFERITEVAADSRIKRCITSFRDDYKKIRKRTAALPHFRFIDPSLEEKVTILIQMADCLKGAGIHLYTCCEKGVLDALPPDCDVIPAACIDSRLLARLYGGHVSFKQDSGQRVKQGCGCGVSVDIGDYKQHPCYHNCLFCYANPAGASDTNQKKSGHPDLEKRVH